MDETDLAGLVGSRLCHDLISPLGAIGNGVELLSLQPGGASPELALIADAVAHANARIRFFRLAFGTASAAHRLGQPELERTLADWTSGGRLRVDWQVAGDLPRAEARMVLLGLLCAESACPRGGDVTVARDASLWRIEARAQPLRCDPDLWSALDRGGPFGTLPPAQVHFALFSDRLRHAGRSLSVEMTQDRLDLRF